MKRVKIDARRAAEMEGQIEYACVSRNKTETKIKESCWLGHSDDETVRSRGNGEDILSEVTRFRRIIQR